jgi:hypothetical protein
MKIGDLVRKVWTSQVRDAAGLGLVIEAHAGTPAGNPGPSYKVQWSNDYGIFWTSEDKLERVSENR